MDIVETGQIVTEGGETPCMSFNAFLSDTAMCKECCNIFCITYIIDGRCPKCGAYTNETDLVVSPRGREASLELAKKRSDKCKELRKHHVITDEEIYREDY